MSNPIQPRVPSANPGDDTYTVEEAARFLRVPPGTLRYWRHLGCGPKSFKLGKHVRYWHADLVLWLAHCKNNPQDGGIHLPNNDIEGGR